MRKFQEYLVGVIHGASIFLIVIAFNPLLFYKGKIHQPEPQIIYVTDKQIPITDSTSLYIRTQTQIINTKTPGQ